MSGPPSQDPDDSLAKAIYNEQTKLAAILFNNVAVSFIVTGAVVPAVAYTYQGSTPGGGYALLYAVLWLAMGAANHQLARLLLRRLKS